MAQIKNIKKPGDLIRGASVGLAGLDKDGNVIGYKAAAADAGKVLTVGEDGSVTPAEGGGGSQLFRHVITTREINNGMAVSFSFDCDVENPFTSISSVCQYLVDNFSNKDFVASGGGHLNGPPEKYLWATSIRITSQVDVYGSILDVSSHLMSFANLVANIGVYTTSISDSVVPV